MFDQSILRPNPHERSKILCVLEAALGSVDPYRAVTQVLHREGELLTVGESSINLADYRRLFIVGAGKAGAPMTQAVEEVLGDRIEQGLVVVKSGHSTPTELVTLVEAGHPIPDDTGVDAGTKILALANQATADDLVITLLSGGGSALLIAPADGITLADLQSMTAALLACGATINEINCLRKHCSAIKGGQLARAAYPARLLTLVLSDVVGSPLDVIASGPTVADTSSWNDAWAIVDKYAQAQLLPAAIIQRLQAGINGTVADTPGPDDPIFEQSKTIVIGDNLRAAEAAVSAAEEQGYNTLLLSTFFEGEAAQAAKFAVALGREVVANGHPLAAPACLILGGETTVSLGSNPGRGGRNQELALAAALELADLPGVTVVSLATDGTDGPTDSAGGMADHNTVARGTAAALSAAEHLRHHDAYPYLIATDDLLRTGPTHTNVNDLIFVFVQKSV